MNQSVHGGVGTREQQFTNLLPLRNNTYDIGLLFGLANKMRSPQDEVHDGPDAEENIWVPAGYTYFGQFIDHDLTFDNTSSLNPADSGNGNRQPTNLRTPRFDLDSVYGDGPDAMPFLYDDDGASLLYKDRTTNQVPFTKPVNNQADQDLLRSPNGRAIIGDKRNDENAIVGQIQLLFIKYHNAVVKKIKDENKDNPGLQQGTGLFERARNQVRWTYQKLVVEDFLRRIAAEKVFEDLASAISVNHRAERYTLYTEDKRENLPREFVVAAYRFGHSGVRQGYRLSDDDSSSRNIFAGSDPNDSEDDTLLGFQPLSQILSINRFTRFFPATGPQETFDQESKVNRKKDPRDPKTRLQFAYKIDTNLVDPLTVLPLNILPTSTEPGGAMTEIQNSIAPNKVPEPPTPARPSLALLNLLRGSNYRVQSGQEIARVLKNRLAKLEPPIHMDALTLEELVVRRFVEKKNDANFYRFEKIDKFEVIGTDGKPVVVENDALLKDTPLWFYILAEAQAPLARHFKIEKPFSEDDLLNGIGASTQLGWVGGRIVAEVFYGLLDSDPDSFVNAAPTGWQPLLGMETEGPNKGKNRAPLFLNLVKFVEENPGPAGGVNPQPKKEAAKAVATAPTGEKPESIVEAGEVLTQSGDAKPEADSVP